MNSLSDIKKRMKVVSDTRKITGAMDTISVSKMSKALEKSEQNSAYFDTLQSVIGDIVVHTSSWVHPCFRKRATSRSIYIVIASDKGLAGGYNHGICDYAFRTVNEKPDSKIIAVGQTVKEYFEKMQFSVYDDFCTATFEPTIEDAAEIADFIIEQFNKNIIDEAYVIYTSLKASEGTQLTQMRLLPLVGSDFGSEGDLTPQKESYLHEIYYEPSPDYVLNRLIPQYIAGIIYGCLLRAQAAEHSARRAAMSEATKNADEILEKLKLEYNRARQSIVTNEITDIITASSGVKNENKQ